MHTKIKISTKIKKYRKKKGAPNELQIRGGRGVRLAAFFLKKSAATVQTMEWINLINRKSINKKK